MVKFSKQFEAQLVPEWKEAFVDYWLLKKDIKNFHFLNNNDNNHNTTHKSNKIFKKFSPFSSHSHREHGAIQVHKKLTSSVSKGDMYETELLEQFEDSDGVKEFFSCLDQQLNKVNRFYKTKEKEFLERADSLKKQMDILIHLKTSSHDSKQDASISCEEDSVKDRAEEEQNMSTEDELERSQELGKSMRMKTEESKIRTLSSRTFNCQGKNLRMSIPLTTPSHTFSAISYLLWEDLVSQSSKGSKNLHINKTKLRHAEKMIKGALVELYKGLGYLKTYRNLNLLAFIKILKKFDKVTGKQILPIYLKVVESSYFNSSDKVKFRNNLYQIIDGRMKFVDGFDCLYSRVSDTNCKQVVMNLADEVEEVFIKHFAKEDKRKGMKYLKPQQHKESHSATFFIGLFTGCFFALLAGYVIMAHITGMYRRQPDHTVYMETVYPVLSMFSLIFLHFFLYGCNIFLWRKTRINYSFIFEFAPTRELKYRDVFLISTVSMTTVVGVMFIHLTLLTKGHPYSHAQAIPGLLSLMFLLLLVCPFNICYRYTRYNFLRIIRNIILSPLYKVIMVDFFMADQLCSQVPMLRNLEYVACYYISGSFKTQDYNYCMRAKHYRDLAYAVSFLPYYWRAMQCARRWFDEGEKSHVVNLGKYVSAMLAAGAKVAYEKEKRQSVGGLCAVVVMSSAATVYQLYWDFVKDWGLLQINSNNPWLRNDLVLGRKFIYYLSMALNLVLRLAWLQTVIHSEFGNVDSRVTGLFLASLEVIRRGQWNFYRLENEHVNNAGKFRAVKTVPLPFHEVDEED